MRLGRAVSFVVTLGVVSLATPADAQLRPRREAATPRPGAAQRIPGSRDAAGANRAQLEQRFRQRLYEMTRKRVGLSDAQMNRLVPVNQRFETQRRGIQRQERETRLALRDVMRDSTHADQSRITGYLDKLLQLQRQRVDLLAQEQRDLAEFMTPLQRARYTALQEQLRRRIEQLVRQNRGARDSTLGQLPDGQ
jgi:membrane-bound lytic murein transglycosylase